MAPVPVLFSLGANLGNRKETLQKAVELLVARVLQGDARISRMYQTEPVGFTEQPEFLNMCVYGMSTLTAPQIRAELRSIERTCGRVERPRWHEREIDIDILLYGTEIINSDELQIPHPRMSNRRFVLVPAADIAPGLVHPENGLTISSMLDQCTDAAQVHVWQEE
ncbi:MAG: hypothetical protein RL156_1053 [Bacteroidota bacterium]|jgi:2-amino-4-hydroxy-6-hydroxymethyldihydropteridine diphosphokinase